MNMDLTFGPIKGQAGTVSTVRVKSEHGFISQKLMATDTALTPGFGTQITTVFIDQKPQRPYDGSGGTLSFFFSQGALGNDLHWDACPPGAEIEIVVKFIEDCEWHGHIEGREQEVA